ncbi:MAG: glycosyltransferase family 4 protein [Planctomycetota bacterium]
MRADTPDLKSAPKAVLIGSGATDHFVGVDQHLASSGLDVVRTVSATLPANTRVVAVSDAEGPLTRRVIRLAGEAKIPVGLLMDGVVEWRNTFCNPRTMADPLFLRPAPASRVLCATEADAILLRAMGNDAVATGLPRLDAISPAPLPEAPKLLVATARTPAFDDAERRRLVRDLGRIKSATDHLGVEVIWRLSARLHLELGVDADTAPLAESLANASAVVTTPSTLALEARLAGRVTALLDPHAAPAWVRADALWRPVPEASKSQIAELANAETSLDADEPMTTFSGAGGLWRLVRTLVDDPESLRVQARVERRAPQSAPERVAREIARCAKEAPSVARPLPSVSRPCIAVPKAFDRRRVVHLFATDGRPLGGVPVWCNRMAAAFNDHPELGYDVRTLAVSTSRWWRSEGDSSLSACLIDPHNSPTAAIRTVVESLERLEPELVIANYADVCHAASAAMRANGVRVIGAMNTFDDAAKDLLRSYNTWDGAVGVSNACERWLETQSAGRPIANIPYGVPLAPAPRRVSDEGPLRLAYVGRMVELQKRISDLHLVLDGLDARGIDAELHLVGDGTDLDRFLATERRRERETTRLVVHGPRSAPWVERFWSTIDVAILVSDAEGMSISMLEAMGQGVVPAVTRVASGANEAVIDGINGVLAPVGSPDEMASRLADLADDRARVGTMSREAWARATEIASIDDAAVAWTRLFDRVLNTGMIRTPTDHACVVTEPHRWKGAASSQPSADIEWCKKTLARSGYTSIAIDQPGDDDDAVVVTTRPTPEVMDQIDAWRADGLGVALAPGLIEPEWVRLARGIRRAHHNGASSIAVYGCGDHTRRAAKAFEWARERGVPVVGLIDDAPRSGTMLGHEVATPLDAAERWNIDAVVLSSDAWEGKLWAGAAPLREKGIQTIALYNEHEAAARVSTESRVA